MTIAVEREVELCIELGRTTLPVDSVRDLRRGSTMSLDSPAKDPVDVYADGELIARGELLIRDEVFFVRVIELIRDCPVS